MERIINFDVSIWENRKTNKLPFLAAHRGVCGSNIPPNTLLAYQIALDCGADVVEIDVSKSKDGKYFVFHPGMEPRYIGCGKYLWELTAKEIEKLPLLNCDGAPTHYRIPSLQDVFALLKGKAYINVDKFWTDIPGITDEIRKAGVEKQVIVKTYTDEQSLSAVETYAPDFMFMPMVRKTDNTTESLLLRNLHFIGNEVLFETERDEVIQEKYIADLHAKGLLVWLNSILYNEADIVSAGHTDDISLEKGGRCGWGWLADRGADFIQTDWLTEVKAFLRERG